MISRTTATSARSLSASSADDGALEYYDGTLRVMDGDGNIIADKINPTKYHDYFGEATEDWSYLKFPYYKPLGYAKGHVPRRAPGPREYLRLHRHSAGGGGAEDCSRPWPATPAP